MSSSVLRGIVFEDGSVFVSFEDRYSVMLHPNPADFTFITPTGEIRDQVTRFATKHNKLDEKIAIALKFRNLSAEDTIYTLKQVHSPSFSVCIYVYI